MHPSHALATRQSAFKMGNSLFHPEVTCTLSFLHRIKYVLAVDVTAELRLLRNVIPLPRHVRAFFPEICPIVCP